MLAKRNFLGVLFLGMLLCLNIAFAEGNVFPVDSVELSHKEIELVLGGDEALKKMQLSCQVNPQNARDKTITWTSSDTAVAVVDETGLVTAVGGGETTIIASSNDPAYEKDEVCSVTVTQLVESVNVNYSDVMLYKGDKFQLNCIVLPETATNAAVVWETSDKNVATVDKTGKVTAKKPGIAVIACTAKDASGAKAECRIQVIAAVQKLSISPKSATMVIGGVDGKGSQLKLEPVLSPENAHYKTAVWKSSDESIAVVDENGVVQALSTGSVTITAETTDPESKAKAAKCQIKVEQAVTRITLNQSSLTLDKGDKTTLKASVGGENAGNKKVTWTSSNPKVAEVTSKGKVTGIGNGKAVITCEAQDGSGVKAECEVTVIVAVSDIFLSEKTIAITKGKTHRLHPTVSPANPTNGKLIYSSSNSRVAEVDENGKITTSAMGTATITIRAADGAGAVETVTVYSEPTNPVDLNRISWKAYLGIVKNKLAFELTNNNQYRTIKSVDYMITCYDASKNIIGFEFGSWNGGKVKPGRTVESKWIKGISGFGYARRLTIAITSVTYTDGTTESCDESGTWVF